MTRPVSRPSALMSAILCLALSCGCAAPETDTTVTSGTFAGLVPIGPGRSLYVTCRGVGAPTVMMVAGLKASADDWASSENNQESVLSGVSRITHVCAYDRPGTPVGEQPSRSTPVAQPTTAADAAADLDALLRAAHLPGPVVLVGHSYGGLIARLMAQTYPGLVAGLVLVDALSEGLQEAETLAQWAMQRVLMQGEIIQSVAEYPALERIDPDRSFDQMRAATPLHAMPMVVLSADRPVGPQVQALIANGTLPKDVPPDFGSITDAAQFQAQARLARLVPGERHITGTNSGHDIHRERPALVIAAITDVIDAVRAGRARVLP